MVAERLVAGLESGSLGGRLEARLRKASGEWVAFDVLTSPQHNTPALQGMVLNLRDATERKAAARDAARRATLTSLALEVSRQALDVGLADLVEALPAMLGKVGELLDVGTCYIDRFDLATMRIDPIACWFPPIREPRPTNLPLDLRELPEWLKVLQRHEPIVAEDLQRERPAWYVEKEEFTRMGTRAGIICPLVAGGDLVGVLGVETANRSRRWLRRGGGLRADGGRGHRQRARPPAVPGQAAGQRGALPPPGRARHRPHRALRPHRVAAVRLAGGPLAARLPRRGGAGSPPGRVHPPRRPARGPGAARRRHRRRPRHQPHRAPPPGRRHLRLDRDHHHGGDGPPRHHHRAAVVDPRHHRPQAARGGAHPPGAHRPAHRAGQPGAAAGAHGRRRPQPPAQRPALLRAPHRPRRLQGDQRHLRPPRGRRGADHAGQPHQLPGRARPTPWPGWAATSSWC